MLLSSLFALVNSKALTQGTLISAWYLQFTGKIETIQMSGLLGVEATAVYSLN